MNYQALIKKGLILLIVLVAAYYGLLPEMQSNLETTHSERSSSSQERGLEDALRQRASNVQMKVSGHVARLLSDDQEGSRHQRFIIKTGNGTTLLVAHNIDLAPRVDGVQVDDPIEVFGEYEWNDRGGVIHWTHHDPARRHQDGWIYHRGKRYQ